MYYIYEPIDVGNKIIKITSSSEHANKIIADNPGYECYYKNDSVSDYVMFTINNVIETKRALDLVERLRIRAHICKQTPKSPQDCKPDNRMADLLEEAADELERLYA